MGALKRTVRNGARGIYRRLPAGSREALFAVRHGETQPQRAAKQAIRRARMRFGVPGDGEFVGGPALRPYRAVVVETYDAREHLQQMREDVESALVEAGIAVYRLPHQSPPVLAVSSRDWEAAWRALAAAPELATMWLRTSSRSTAPVSAAPEVTQTSCRLFRRLVSPEGSHVADQRAFIRLQRWEEVTVADEPRPDGGFLAPGTLLRPEEYNTFAAYLSPEVQETLRVGSATFREYPPDVSAFTAPIDIVYTWVDGEDSAWRAKRARWSGEGYSPDAQVASRFESHDELKYSLRSVEMYASWVRHIYLVTDDQVPSWLNPDHPKLTVVDHRDLFDESELPVFNSHAIESRLHRIEGLSEHFLYLNDDMLFGRPVRAEQFFTGGGLMKFFPSPARIDPAPPCADDISVSAAAKNNRALLEAALGRTMTAKLKHTPYAHRRSVLAELEERFPEVFAGNVAARFRTQGDHSLVSSLAQRYAATTGRAIEGRIKYNYADISRPDIRQLLARWLRSRSFDVFCLNDAANHDMTEEKVRAVSEFLDGYFPLPSRFEA